MFQMSFSASRATRLLLAVGVVWLGLALSAQAAHATYSKIQIVKINQGGDQNDVFTFDTGLTPSPSPSSFTLKGGQASSVFSVECNASSDCTSRWGTITQTVTERPTSGYTLTGVVCRSTTGSGTWGAAPGPATPVDKDTTFDAATRKITFKLDWWEQIRCEVTNTRDTGTIKVTKKVVAPAGDTGRFNLLVDGTAKATDVGDGGTTGVQSVITGTHAVSETAGTATDMTNYDSATSCLDTAHADKPADTDGSLQVAAGDAWECVITNTRKSSPPSETPPVSQPPVSQPPVQVVSPQIAVSPARVRPGSARLRGPSGCPTTSVVAATVSGRRIVKVTFYVDGKRVKTLTKTNRKGQWVLPMNLKRFAFGTHRVRVTVQFAASSQTAAKTLRLSFSRCHPAVVTPKFTG
jgi:hypothetical protein